MSENPGRNWGILLHQAWVLHMKERISVNKMGNTGPIQGHHGDGQNGKNKRGNGKT